MKTKSIPILILIALLTAACTKAPAEETYTVDITAADFVAVVDNPYFPCSLAQNGCMRLRWKMARWSAMRSKCWPKPVA
jgi:hypothetical protein